MTGVSRAPSEEGGVGLARAGRLHVLPQAPGQGAARSATYQLSGARQPEVGSYFRVFNNSRLYYMDRVRSNICMKITIL